MKPDSTVPSGSKWEYGKLRKSQTWIAWVVLCVGVLSLPIAWLIRDRVEVGGNVLPNWTVLLVGAMLACIGLAMSISLLLARSRPAKLIVLADRRLTVPGGLLIGSGWTAPVSDVSVRTIELGFVKQMQLTTPRKRSTLSSALFASDHEFDRLFDAIAQTAQSPAPRS